MTPGRSLLLRYFLRIVHRARSGVPIQGFRTANGASPSVVVTVPLRRHVIHDRWLALLEAACTKVMGWFALSHAFLQRKHERSGIWAYKLVALLLAVPVFHAFQFLFRIVFLMQ